MIYVLIIIIHFGSYREVYRWTEHETKAECVAAGDRELVTLSDNFTDVEFVCRREKR